MNLLYDENVTELVCCWHQVCRSKMPYTTAFNQAGSDKSFTLQRGWHNYRSFLPIRVRGNLAAQPSFAACSHPERKGCCCLSPEGSREAVTLLWGCVGGKQSQPRAGVQPPPLAFMLKEKLFCKSCSPGPCSGCRRRSVAHLRIFEEASFDKPSTFLQISAGEFGIVIRE